MGFKMSLVEFYLIIY